MQYLAAYFISGLFLPFLFYLLGKIKQVGYSSFVFLLWTYVVLSFRHADRFKAGSQPISIGQNIF